jgi:hypothetical protein
VGALGGWPERGARFSIDRRKAVEERALPQSINLIVKRRCALVGLGATEFAAHGLRSAYLAARQSIPLPWTMQQRRQRSVQQAPGYKVQLIRDA